LSLPRRVEIACASLRTNLAIRELAAVFSLSRAQAHRIVSDLVARLATMVASPTLTDRRGSWSSMAPSYRP